MKTLLALFISLICVSQIQAQETEYYYKYKQKKYMQESKDFIVVHTSEKKTKKEFYNLVTNIPNLNLESSQLFGDRTLLIKVKGDKNTAIEALRKNNEISKINNLFETIDEKVDLFWNNEISIQFMSDVPILTINKLIVENNLEIITVSKAAPSYLLRLSKDEDVLKVANKLAVLEEVLYCHPNFYSYSLKHTNLPQDQYFNEQFYLKNTGQGTRWGTSTSGADIKMETAWNITTGSTTINITILDDGLDLNHPDISSSKILQGYDYGNLDANVQPIGDNAHGTCCSGIIAADHNTIGVAGIAPGCSIRMHKIFDDDGNGASTSALTDAIDDAWLNGADVISNSWSYNSSDPDLIPEIKEAVLTRFMQ